MKKDTLLYRYPGDEIIRQAGILKSVANNEITEGFVFTDFEAAQCYLFEASETLEESVDLHFKTEKPYVFTQREYLQQAHAFLNGIHQMNLGKAIFSRIKSTTFDSKKAVILFESLCAKYPDALVYLLSSELTGTWIGASPEVLLEAHEDYLFTMALAGTRKPSEVEEWGEKEINEQEMVADFITDQFKELQLDNIESVGPYDFEAGPINHLRTDISAELSGTTPWKVALNLHPTPAVSGLPRPQAIALIHSAETHDRGLYTGMLGLISKDSAQLFVNLRCAQIQESTAYLYLGGGFTPQSVPELEWQETENKSRTLLNVMDLIS